MPQNRVALQELPPAADPPRFVCLRIDYGQTVRIIVAGELDIATVPRLDRALRQAEADAPLVVLDLLRLEFVASCGVRLLHSARRRIAEGGGRLRIMHAPAGFDRILALIDSAER